MLVSFPDPLFYLADFIVSPDSLLAPPSFSPSPFHGFTTGDAIDIKHSIFDFQVNESYSSPALNLR